MNKLEAYFRLQAYEEVDRHDSFSAAPMWIYKEWLEQSTHLMPDKYVQAMITKYRNKLTPKRKKTK